MSDVYHFIIVEGSPKILCLTYNMHISVLSPLVTVLSYSNINGKEGSSCFSLFRIYIEYFLYTVYIFSLIIELETIRELSQPLAKDLDLDIKSKMHHPRGLLS
jgi:hypothetical protein